MVSDDSARRPDARPRRTDGTTPLALDAPAPTSRPLAVTRRRFAQAGLTALAAGLAGCSAGSDAASGPPSSGSWPPDPDGSPLLARTYYPEWMDWARDAFPAADVRPLGSPFGWQVKRPFGDGLVGQFRRWFDSGSSYSGPRRKLDLVSLQDWRLDSGLDLLQPLPVEQMPAWEHVRDRFTDVDFYRRGGETYGVPVEATLYPLTYDTETFDQPPDSWELLFDSEFAGDAVWGGHPFTLAPTAAQYTGQDPRRPTDFDAIRGVLEQHYDRLETAHDDDTQSPTDAFFLTSAEAVEAFASGATPLGSLDMSQMYVARFLRGASLDYTAPAEGALFRAFFFGVPEAAPHPQSSKLFVNWALRPANATRLVELERFMPAVDVGDRVADDVASFFEWPDGWDLRYDDPRTSEETELRYSKLLREVYGLGV